MKLMAIALAALMISAAGADAARKKDNIGILRGVVLDSSDKQPVGWATVAIMKSDSTLVNGIACNDKGEYELIVARASTCSRLPCWAMRTTLNQ